MANSVAKRMDMVNHVLCAISSEYLDLFNELEYTVTWFMYSDIVKSLLVLCDITYSVH